MNWETLLKIGHIVGTVLGVGGATFAEVFSLKAAGKPMGPDSGMFFKSTYTILRIGLVILVLSGFGFLLLLRLEGETQHIYSPRLWVKIIITLVILVNAVLLHLKKIPFKAGSAISLASWYAALIIGSWRMQLDFWQLLGAYIVFIFAVAWTQGLVRKRMAAKT